MNIKKLEIQGFKSFSDRTKILFHPGITAVVGPNGTGKSNIVDSLLWVLKGKRLKSLRGERSGDVIFNGNLKKAPMNMADVTLFLGDGEDELIINHRLFRSGESEFRMNGKAVRLKDIQEILWKKSIGETAYFVIEQGSIGQFLSSKPIEKRLLLEEAAGTAYYKDKKQHTQRKLEETEQNLIRLEDIIAEVSKGKNSLKRQAHAAIQYRKLREKIRELTLLLFREKIDQLEKSRKETAISYRKSLSRENEITAQLKIEEKNLAEKRKEVWEFEQFNKEAQKDLFALKTQVSRLESEKENGSRQIDSLSEKSSRARKNREEFKQELASLEKEQNEIEKNLKVLNETLEQRENDLKDLNQAEQASREKLESIRKEIKTLRNEHLIKLSSYTEIRNEEVKLDKELELTLRQEEKLSAQIESNHNLFLQKTKKLEQSSDDITGSWKILDEKKLQFKTQQNSLKKIQSGIENLQTQLAKLRQKKDEALHHLHALEKMQEKGQHSDAAFPGTLGVLADLIETDSEHAFLIDVLWKEESKASLIHTEDFLKNFAGRELKGDFLLFSPGKKERVFEKAYQDQRIVGRLKAHVKPDPKIKDYLPQLREAAIVNDIKTALELWISYPSINFITVRGEVLLSSGLLKSGRKKEGIFALTQEIRKLKENIVLADKEISPINLEITRKNNEKQKLEEKIKIKSTEIAHFETQIIGEEKEKEYEQREKEKIEANLAILKKELSILSEEKQDLTNNFEAIFLRSKKLEEEQEALKEKIKTEEETFGILQGKSEHGKKQYFEVKSSIDILKEKIKNLNQQYNSINQRKEIIEARIISLDKEIQFSEKQKMKIQENINSITKTAVALEKENNEKENKLLKNESHMNIILNEQHENEERIKSIREKYEAQKEERVQKEIKKAEKDRDMVNLEESCWQELKKTAGEIKNENISQEKTERNIEELLTKAKEKLQKFKSVNLLAEEEYLIQKKRFDFLTQENEDLRESIDSTKEAIRKIDQESKIQFQKALNEVNKNFQEVFSLLFEGGHTEVKLSQPSQPLESGIEIIAQPPGKKVNSLNLLSGGEKSLTSLAFFFALFRYKPAPFCILDEVDAALDETNLTRFLNLMRKVKKQTQFILITHNFKSMEVADYIYGTTMPEPNITNIYALKLEKKEAEERK